MILFFSALALVFLLGLQQQHITHGKHGWSAITSFAIAAAQVGFVQSTVGTDFATGVLLLGAGGALGASASMIVHRRWICRPRNVIGETL